MTNFQFIALMLALFALYSCVTPFRKVEPPPPLGVLWAFVGLVHVLMAVSFTALALSR